MAPSVDIPSSYEPDVSQMLSPPEPAGKSTLSPQTSAAKQLARVQEDLLTVGAYGGVGENSFPS